MGVVTKITDFILFLAFNIIKYSIKFEKNCKFLSSNKIDSLVFLHIYTYIHARMHAHTQIKPAQPETPHDSVTRIKSR